MTEFLYSIDLSVFYFFNHTLNTPALSRFFSMITDVNSWYITYVVLLGLLVVKGGKRGRIAVGLVLLIIIITDQTGANVIKNIFERLRPCNALADAVTPLGCTGSYSFPSNHALNNFAAAGFFATLYRAYRYPLYITAALIAISRVYLGLHYPSDIIAGAILGALFGWFVAWLQLRYVENWFGSPNPSR